MEDELMKKYEDPSVYNFHNRAPYLPQEPEEWCQEDSGAETNERDSSSSQYEKIVEEMKQNECGTEEKNCCAKNSKDKYPDEGDIELINKTLIEKCTCIEDKISEMSKSIDSMKGELDGIQKYGEAVALLKTAVTRNQQNEERIYKELDIAKKDERYSMIKPFLEFMVSQHIDLLNSKKQYENDKEAVIDELGEKAYSEIISLHDFQMEAIESQLKIQGILLEEYVPDSEFNATEQMPSKTTVETEDNSKIGKVAYVEHCCYKYNDKILRKAKVRLYKAGK